MNLLNQYKTELSQNIGSRVDFYERSGQMRTGILRGVKTRKKALVLIVSLWDGSRAVSLDDLRIRS